MKTRIYRTINLPLSEDEKTSSTDLESIYQVPIDFISVPKKLDKGDNSYYENLLEVSDNIQHIPLFVKKPYNYLLKIKNILEKRIVKLEEVYEQLLDENAKLSNILEKLNYYLKLADIFPEIHLLDNINSLLESLTATYGGLNGLANLNKWWSVFNSSIREQLILLENNLENKIILDNYDRLNINIDSDTHDNGYTLNNRVDFNDFMKNFSDKSMHIPHRIIKNYNLVSNNKAVLSNITLSNQQKFVSDYLNSNTPYRGLLLYHGLGSGKSGASIAITNGYKNRKVVILLPASLKINYLQEIEKFGESCFKSNLNWEFFEMPFSNTYELYNWSNTHLVNKYEHIGENVTFNQTQFNIYSDYKLNKKTPIKDKIIGNILINSYVSLKNTFYNMLNNLGISRDLLSKISTTHDGQKGIWLLNTSVTIGDIIQEKITHKLYKITAIRKKQIYLAKIDKQHIGGGKCKLCGADKTTSRNCPLNENAKKVNFKKHIEGTKEYAIINAKKAAEAFDEEDLTVEIRRLLELSTFPAPKITPNASTGQEDAELIIPQSNLPQYAQYVINQNYSQEEKTSICKQIKECFKHKYELCSYNAGAYTIINIFKNLIPNFSELMDDKSSSQITKDDINSIMLKISSGEIKNPFTDKVVVIDEIHNLISLIMPNTDSVNFNGGVLFELLMKAENVRLVCLSGTPSINDVFEFSILYNIINGLIKSFQLQISSKDALLSLDTVKIEKFLSTHKIIDRYVLGKNKVNITRIPQGFVKVFDHENNYTGVKKNKLNDGSDKEFIEELIQSFEYAFPSYQISFEKINSHTIFNSILDTTRSWEQRMIGDSQFVNQQINLFKNTYIDLDENILYPRNFKNNIAGLTSFYNERKTDNEGNLIFPEVETIPQNIEFSMYQFIKYCAAREEERKKEKLSRLGKFMKGSANIKSSFKTSTRQISIFAFPPEITRVTKKNLYDVEYIMSVIEEYITILSSGGSIGRYKTIKHKKIKDKITELYELKVVFLNSMLKPDIIHAHAERGVFDPEILLMSFLQEEITESPATETPKQVEVLSLKLKINIKMGSAEAFEELNINMDKNKNFFIRLCTKINELVQENSGVILAGNTDAILELIKTEMGEHYLSYNLESDKYDIFEGVDFDSEYEDNLEEQIQRITESDLYLNLDKFVSGESYNLSWLSPKYINIFNNLIKSPGSVFIYSQYLNAEGIRLFTEVLKKNGFKELNWNRGVFDISKIRDEQSGNDWCSIMNNKRVLEGEFNDDNTIEPGNLIRWTREENSKYISTTHRVIKVDDTEMIITKVFDPESSGDKYDFIKLMYQNDDLNSFKKSDLIKIPSSKFKEISICRYVLWTGKQTDTQERIDILKKFNSGDNKYGQDCLILLATSSGAEGISLKNVRQVHIMEPYWNNVRRDQVIGRARRVKSHIQLEPDQRNVSVFTYVCKFSQIQLEQINTAHDLDSDEITQLITDINSLDKTSSKTQSEAENIETFIKLLNKLTSEVNSIDRGKSTDEYLTIIAEKKAILLNKFLYMIKENAVDCILNLDENITSDPENLGSLECHTTDISIDGLSKNKGYIYNFNPLVKSEQTLDSNVQKELQTTREASVKYQVLNFKLSNDELGLNDVKLKCVLFPNKNQRQIQNNSVLYNYYSFFSINFLQTGKKIKIGKYIDATLELDSDFLQYVKLFDIIDKCEEEVKNKNVEFKSNFLGNNDKVEAFKDSVYECYLDKIKPTKSVSKSASKSAEDSTPASKWRCPLCDTINKNTDSICGNDECDMELDDL